MIQPPPVLLNPARVTAAPLSLTWTATNQCLGNNPAPINIVSNGYLFRILGGPGNQPPLSFSSTITNTQQFGSIAFTENIQVPSSVLAAVQNSGANALFIERTFTDGVVSKTASAQVFFTGVTGAPFEVSRLALRYDDGSRVKIIPENGPLSVIADINFNGSGLLQAQWEIAGPTAPGGIPFFRPLQLVRQYLVGRQYAELTSPPLPSTVDGMYFVRLIVQNPDRQQVSPLLRYFVGEYSEEAAVALQRDLPQTIAALGPQPGAAAAKGLQFAWSPVQRAATYQIEVYALDALDDKFVPADQPNAHSSLLVRKRPVTGIAVPAGQTSAEMSQLVKDYLQPGSYWWRVVANDKHGAVIAAGPLRRIEVR